MSLPALMSLLDNNCLPLQLNHIENKPITITKEQVGLAKLKSYNF